jgi:hypothetical protein
LKFRDRIVRQLGVHPDERYHWRTHQGAELDLLVWRGGLRLGFEVKRTVATTLTPSTRWTMQDLNRKSLTVVHSEFDLCVVKQDSGSWTSRLHLAELNEQ